MDQPAEAVPAQNAHAGYVGGRLRAAERTHGDHPSVSGSLPSSTAISTNANTVLSAATTTGPGRPKGGTSNNPNRASWPGASPTAEDTSLTPAEYLA